MGELGAEQRWVQTKVEGWAESVKTLAGVARKHPQSAYAGLQKSLQQEWEFIQRFTPDIGDTFGPVEEVLRDTFIPVLSKGVGEGTPVWGVTCLPVKQAGLALLDPTKASPENWVESCVKTGNLVAALRVQGDFRTEDHAAYLKEGREEFRKWNANRSEEALEETLAGDPVQVARCLRRLTNMGAWLIVQPSTVNGTEFGAQEWRYSLFLRYGLDPPDHPKSYDGCNAAFSIYMPLTLIRVA